MIFHHFLHDFPFRFGFNSSDLISMIFPVFRVLRSIFWKRERNDRWIKSPQLILDIEKHSAGFDGEDQLQHRMAIELGAISKLRCRTTQLRISMYADDAIIFINPTRGNVKAFVDILDCFVTNLQKSQVAAIRCDSIDLAAQPIYLLAALEITKESLEQLDKQRRRFLWASTGDIIGGKCKVNWTKTCLPTSQGGLGVLNLDKFMRTLRLRLLWNEWKDLTKPWVGGRRPGEQRWRRLAGQPWQSGSTASLQRGSGGSSW
uniref:Reverse transcriptase domain-containing protein n=1 Tax=Oryza sativa subsp. japonica TaxID=39947 RepID=Q9FW29_ORYSJ|nr:hypothetical protein [Oryza sativa Japonica Group]